MALPPGPRTPGPVNLLRLALQPLTALHEWHARYGDVFTVRFTGFGTGVYVADPDEIRAMFSGDQSQLRAGEANSFLEPVLGPHSVLVLDGPEHLRQRRLLLGPFQGAHVTAFREVIRDVAEREVDGWRAGERIVLRERMRALTFEVICRAVFGVSEPLRVARLRAALMAVIDRATVFLAPGPLRLDLGPLSPGGRFARRLRAADELLYEEIARRRGEPDLERRTDVLSLLLCARDEHGQGMSDAELRDELFTMLAAGHETTATGLAFALELLLRNPRVLARLREELGGGGGEAAGGELPGEGAGFTGGGELAGGGQRAGGGEAYLDATVKEALRLRPVIDSAERTLAAPRMVAGWELPAGVNVYPAILLVHHREDLYPRAREFRPERFVEDGAESYTWLPFGGGIRRCIGAALAQAEMAEVLRIVVTRTELEPERPEPDPVVLRGVTLAPKHGVPVRVLRVGAGVAGGGLVGSAERVGNISG
ncbi:MAG TPA: cytochrome P450 [Solirubrobacteraceae bacterium]